MSENKVAIVTGGSSGAGRAICLMLAEEGYSVVNADISPVDKLGGKNTHEEILDGGGDALYVESDLGAPGCGRTIVQPVIDAFGRIDVLINNAGVLCASNLVDTTEEMWDRTLAINLRGPFLLSQAVVPHFIHTGAGRIVNVSSVFGLLGHVASTSYIASKGGLISLTKQMAMELGKYNITVNAILPSTIYTGFFTEQRLNDPDAIVASRELISQEKMTRLKARSPLGRIVDPIDVAEATRYLVSDVARNVTGVLLPVDGGVLAGRLD